MRFDRRKLYLYERAGVVQGGLPGLQRHAGRPRPEVASGQRARGSARRATGPAGNAFDSQGRLYTCETRARRVVRAERNGRIEVLAERWEGKRLNAPNDLAVSRGGHVYFTDPAFGEASDYRELDFYGVYHIPPKGPMKLVARPAGRPNGIAFSPNGRVLYVGNADEHDIRAYDVDRDGDTSGERVLVAGIAGVPAGMAVDEKGNLYVAAGGIAVYTAAAGRWIRSKCRGEPPAARSAKRTRKPCSSPEPASCCVCAATPRVRIDGPRHSAAGGETGGETGSGATAGGVLGAGAAAADRRYPPRPLIGVGAIMLRRDRVLMARRGKEPLKGWWSLPGGLLEIGETLDDAVRREMREETGLEIRPLGVLEIFERIMRDPSGAPEYHYVLIDYFCRVDRRDAECRRRRLRGGMGAPARSAELEITEGTLAVIEKAFRERGKYR